MRGGPIATLFEAPFEVAGGCAFSPPRSDGVLPPVWRFTSLLPQLERANRYLHLNTRHEVAPNVVGIPTGEMTRQAR